MFSISYFTVNSRSLYYHIHDSGAKSHESKIFRNPAQKSGLFLHINMMQQPESIQIIVHIDGRVSERGILHPDHPLLLYLPTVPVIWCALFLCGAEKERMPSHFFKMQAAYYRQSGLLFYVLQIAMIRVTDLSAEGIGIESFLIWQWCRPILICGILFLLSRGIAKIRYCLVKRSASV